MVRLYRTFSNYIFPGETRFAGCLRTSSGWIKRIEPPRTFSNHIIAEIARCVEFFHMSSGWFDCAEPSLTRGSKVRDSRACRVLSYEFGVVQLYRTFSNYIFTGETRCAGCSCTSSGWFKCIEPPRTFSNHIITDIARCVEFFHMSSGWFDCTEHSLTTYFQGKQVCRVLMH